jgi:hypothetical protein
MTTATDKPICIELRADKTSMREIELVATDDDPASPAQLLDTFRYRFMPMAAETARDLGKHLARRYSIRFTDRLGDFDPVAYGSAPMTNPMAVSIAHGLDVIRMVFAEVDKAEGKASTDRFGLQGLADRISACYDMEAWSIASEWFYSHALAASWMKRSLRGTPLAIDGVFIEALSLANSKTVRAEFRPTVNERFKAYWALQELLEVLDDRSDPRVVAALIKLDRLNVTLGTPRNVKAKEERFEINTAKDIDRIEREMGFAPSSRRPRR